MPGSIGLTLYALGGRRGPPERRVRPERPAGRLVWLHAPSADSARGVMELARRLSDEDGVLALFTGPAVGVPPPPGVLLDTPPEDTPDAVAPFLDHWAPDLVLMSEGELLPAALHDAGRRRIPVVMAEARAPHLPRGRDGWYPGLMRASIRGLRHVFALDAASSRAYLRAGLPEAAVEVTGRLEVVSAALPCLEAERAALVGLLRSRPVWLAAALPPAEEAAVIGAHRAALRMAHRLLLILVPEDPARAAPLAARLAEEEDWVVAERAADREPEPDVEVFVADSPAELGLWYRLAPVTFLGGSLSGEGCLRDPMEPAALGSAILHGPRAGVHGAAFGRLGAARAARAVAGPRDLAEALSDLLAPDRAARLAQAAWDVASEGAETTDRVLDLLRGLLEGAR
jgi:3-deoxy-D-manno-octulosonic-acid transferase